MIARFTPFLIFVLSCGGLRAQSAGAEGGMIRIYSDQLQGRVTASGELYEVSALTGAHASLPLGTMGRVANFESGKMVDVRINDRKRSDSTLIHLSRAAARRTDVPPKRAARGSMMVIGTMPPLSSAVSKERSAPLLVPNSTDAPAQKRFAPSQAFKKDPLPEAGNEPEDAARLAGNEQSTVPSEKRVLVGRRKDVQYGIPAEQYAPPAIAHNTANRSVGGQWELVPLSAGAQIPARSAPAALPPRSSSSAAVAPYRV